MRIFLFSEDFLFFSLNFAETKSVRFDPVCPDLMGVWGFPLFCMGFLFFYRNLFSSLFLPPLRLGSTCNRWTAWCLCRCQWLTARLVFDVSCSTTKPTKWREPSKDSDQPWHLPSLMRVFAVCLTKPRYFATQWAHSEDLDQSGWMPRLIWIFAGSTGHFVGFVMLRLICLKSHKFRGNVLTWYWDIKL